MILIVDDDDAVRLSLRLLLTRNGYQTAEAASPREAMDFVRSQAPRLIMLDMNYSRSTTGEEGLTLLKQIRLFRPETPVILMTAWGSIPLAVEGIHAGAFDFVTKPWNNAALLQRVNVALELNSARDVTAEAGKFDRSFIIGRSPLLLNVLDTIERIAATDAPVLIMGENGTGKELIAEAIHRNSRRRSRRMVKVNLGGIASSLFESEMFGHKKGAFTGAVSDRIGRFSMADKGTIFLDEIGELDLNSQVKLLRVLQEHTFEMLGDSRSQRVDIRVVCATNADLSEMVRERTFREDLFYRINLITVTLPPLRERPGDIPDLVDHFSGKFCRQNGFDIPEISDSALKLLAKLPYPGNIRELKNLVERTILMARKPCLDDTDFNFAMSQSGKPVELLPIGASLDEIELNAIKVALRRSDGNVSLAAESLGITRQSLYRRMEKYGISI